MRKKQSQYAIIVWVKKTKEKGIRTGRAWKFTLTGKCLDLERKEKVKVKARKEDIEKRKEHGGR